MKITTHFFDVDHTLTSQSTGVQFVLEAARLGHLKAKYLWAIPRLALKYKFGKLKPEAFELGFPGLSGFELSLLEEIASHAFERRIKADLFPGALALISGIKAAGGRVVLATASLDFLVKPLADMLGVDGVVASSLEFQDGVSTGRFAGKLVFGPMKREAVIAAAGGEALSGCAFYSDSIHDLPLLLEAGKPVVVNPDKRLEREARARGWEQISFRH
jgi:HAD superfamily hydrolase (TIGR01490 family)